MQNNCNFQIRAKLDNFAKDTGTAKIAVHFISLEVHFISLLFKHNLCSMEGSRHSLIPCPPNDKNAEKHNFMAEDVFCWLLRREDLVSWLLFLTAPNVFSVR
uniref:Uncharacterized protein n=1 Tax=Sphaerodactylus townsendi TaxID=933632 RepID=A0ACB8ESK9_9SAUR